MTNLGRVAANGKIIILVGVVLISFFFSSLGWRHVESTERGRVIVSASILLLLYVLIVLELVNRNLAALIGAAASVAAYACLVEFVTMEQLLDWLDLETLSLLFGMMIIVNVLSGSGLFDFLAIWSYKQSRGRFWLLISMMSIITALLSALVDNVSTMLLLSPTLIKLSELEHIDPRHVLMIMVIVSNIGGCATPVGDPPNLIIIGNELANKLDINFGSFTAYCVPGVCLTLLCLLVYLKLRYKSKESFRGQSTMQLDGHDDDSETPAASQGELADELEALSVFVGKLDSLRRPLSEASSQLRAQLDQRTKQLHSKLQEQLSTSKTTATTTTIGMGQFVEPAGFEFDRGQRKSSRLNEEQIGQLMRTHRIKDHRTLYESLAVLCAAILLFFVQSIPGLQLTLGWVSLFAGLTLLVLNSRHGDHSFEEVVMRIEWTTLLFFSALFVTMEAMARLGLIGFLGNQVTLLIGQLPEGRLREMGAITIVLWASGLASACIDNVPFTSMMIKVLASMIEADRARATPDSPPMKASALRALVFALSFGCCFGGNGSLIGASANLVTAGLSARLGYPITFNGFFKFAAPITVLTLMVANLYLIVVFVWLGL